MRVAFWPVLCIGLHTSSKLTSGDGRQLHPKQAGLPNTKTHPQPAEAAHLQIVQRLKPRFRSCAMQTLASIWGYPAQQADTKSQNDTQRRHTWARRICGPPGPLMPHIAFCRRWSAGAGRCSIAGCSGCYSTRGLHAGYRKPQEHRARLRHAEPSHLQVVQRLAPNSVHDGVQAQALADDRVCQRHALQHRRCRMGLMFKPETLTIPTLTVTSASVMLFALTDKQNPTMGCGSLRVSAHLPAKQRSHGRQRARSGRQGRASDVRAVPPD